MDTDQASADHCADCHHPLEIITVRFSLAGAEIILACPHCAIGANGGAGMTKQPEAATIDARLLVW